MSATTTKANLDAQINEAVRYTICYYTGFIGGLGIACETDVNLSHDISARVLLLVQNSTAAIEKHCCIAQDVMAVLVWAEWFTEKSRVTKSSTPPVWFYYFYTMGFMNGSATAASIKSIETEDARQDAFVGAPMLAETQDRGLKAIFELQFMS